MKRVLITGADGQLARAIANFAPTGIECVRLSRHDVDITDQAAIRSVIEARQPDYVINGAAYNLVDKAETDGMADAIRINVQGAGCLAQACRDTNTPLVHFSTDFVFDGAKRESYVEEDATHPLGIYAATKLGGENIALATSPRNVVIRVCRLFGPALADSEGSSRKPAANFPMLMLRLGRERDSVRVVNDQIGTPSYTPDLARGVWQLLQNGASGLYQLSNEGAVSFDDYTREVFRLAGIECAVESVSSAEYGAPARRPAYSVMSNAKAYAAGVSPLRHWKDALREFIEYISISTENPGEPRS